jgi:CarD family transcriptional regulator
MFKVGEKVFIPVHGIGTIEKIENKVIFDQKRSYYVIKLENDSTHIMVPADKNIQVDSQVRKLFSKKESNTILDVLKSKAIFVQDARERIKQNLKKIKTGNPYLKAEVIRDLNFIGSKKALSRNDKEMLEKMKKIFVSELSLVLKNSKEESSTMVEKLLKKSYSRN